MTNSLNKEVISPVLEQGQGHLFHTAGTNFKVTGSHIEIVKETNNLFNTLVSANNKFNINEKGISFFYDYNSKNLVSKVEEGSIENFNKLMSLTEKLAFLENSAKEHRLANHKSALVSINKELDETYSKLAETKTSQLAIEIIYVKESNKFFTGNVEIAMGSEDKLSEMLFTAGYIKYEHKSLLETFQTAAENFESFKVLDFLTEAIAGDITVVSMRAEKNTFVFRTNESTKISKFEKMLADAAIEYVAEETGADITTQFEDILESNAKQKALKLEQIQEFKEMLTFLYDQKGRLAEADRNLTDIKAADKLIGSEIKRISEVLEALEDSSLGIEDGYVDATVKTEELGIEGDGAVKVDSLEFSTAGKNDILTVFANDKPYRIEKYKINISSNDTI